MGSATYCSPAQYSEQPSLIAFVQAMITCYFMEANVILLARAEAGQGEGPFLSAPICVIVSSLATD